MAKIASYIRESEDSHTPEGAEIQWRHYDVLASVIGDKAVSAIKATDFRERAFYQHQERTLDEVLAFVRKQLPDPRFPQDDQGDETGG